MPALHCTVLSMCGRWSTSILRARDARGLRCTLRGFAGQGRTDQPFVTSTKQHFCQVNSAGPTSHIPLMCSVRCCRQKSQQQPCQPTTSPVNSITTNQSPGPRTGGLARESTSRNGNSGFLSIARNRNECPAMRDPPSRTNAARCPLWAGLREG